MIIMAYCAVMYNLSNFYGDVHNISHYVAVEDDSDAMMLMATTS
jgi:hypothetical protein